jgi:hypothetical protein
MEKCREREKETPKYYKLLGGGWEALINKEYVAGVQEQKKFNKFTCMHNALRTPHIHSKKYILYYLFFLRFLYVTCFPSWLLLLLLLYIIPCAFN